MPWVIVSLCGCAERLVRCMLGWLAVGWGVLLDGGGLVG